MTKAVAIDGPAGAGKSSIARRAAAMLGFIYVDTGALYRAIGVYAMEHDADTKSTEEVTPLLPAIHVEIKFLEGRQHVFVNGEDVSDKIRTAEASMAASNVSAIPSVRAFLFDLQRSLAASANVIMDGRDIGTVVLPNADLKLFLTATPEERARRRYEQMQKKGESPSYEEILADIKVRDHNDSTRAIAPLKQAEDAILLDTTGNTLEQSIELLTSIIKERLSLTGVDSNAI